MSLEMNPENPHPIFGARPCRRIVLDDDAVLEQIDSAWRDKLLKGAGGRGDIILSKSTTQIPKGFKVVEEVAEGTDLGKRKTDFEGRETHKAIHVCHNPRHGSLDGMKYRWVAIAIDSQSQF